jgi:hypothetical protein
VNGFEGGLQLFYKATFLSIRIETKYRSGLLRLRNAEDSSEHQRQWQRQFRQFGQQSLPLLFAPILYRQSLGRRINRSFAILQELAELGE